MSLTKKIKNHFFKPHWYFSRAGFNLIAIFLLSIGFAIGTYLTLSKIITNIFATAQSSTTITSNTQFNQGTLSGLSVSGSGDDGSLVSSAYQYSKKITIDHTKVDDDLTDYPLTLVTTDSDLATTVNGGHVQNTDSSGGASGSLTVPADLIFSSTSDCSTQLDHEVEKYSDSTGELVAHIKIPSLSSSQDTEIYVCYGLSSAVTTQENTSDVWSNNYLAVYHMSSDPSGITYDSTQYGNNGTSTGSMDSSDLVNGVLGQAVDFDGIDDKLEVSDSASLQNLDGYSTSYSVEFWANTTEAGDSDFDQALIERRSFTGDISWVFNIGPNDSGYENCYIRAVDYVFWEDPVFTSGSTKINDGNWHNVVFTRNNSNLNIYADGSLGGSETVSYGSDANSDQGLLIAARQKNDGSYDDYMDAQFDEIRISSINRSSTWVSTTHNNQSDPSSFYSVGSESNLSSGVYTSPSGANAIDLNWNGGWGDGSDESTAFSADVTVPTGGSILFEVRSDSNSNFSTATDWVNVGTATEIGTFTATALDLSSVTSGSNRYVQVRATFESGDGASQLNSYTLNYLSDSNNPETNPSVTSYPDSSKTTSIITDSWSNDADPYFSFSGAADATPSEENSGVQGYCVYFGTDQTADPASTKGLLGTNEQSNDNSNCPYVTYNSYLDMSSALSGSLDNGSTYYLNIRAKDYQGNTYTASGDHPYDQFIYKYDSTSPTNPGGLSAPQTYKNDIDSIIVYWATSGSNAASDSASGVQGYQYKIGDTGTWYGSSHTGDEDVNDLITTGSYTLNSTHDSLSTGENTFYLRTWDNAGNVSSSSITAILKYSGNAPTEPQELSVDPSTSETNSFSFSWTSPNSYIGQESGLQYCYTVNTVPSVSSCTWTTNTSLSAGAYATQPSTNTFYVVAKDEASNVNYDAYSSINFTANTSAPGISRSMDVADISIKSTENWRLAVSWEEPSDLGAGVESYQVYRSTTNTDCSSDISSFSQIGTTAGTSYTDTGLTQQTYYYCTKACDSANNCSAVSSTVSGYPDGKYTSAADLTSGPSSSSITTKKATIAWTTDRNSDSKIEYGPSSGEYFDEEVSNSTQTTDHSLTLNNLNAGTTYYYKVKWTDEDGNTGTSEEKSFSTDPPPVVKDVKASNIGIDSAIIDFSVQSASKVKIYYGQSTTFGGLKEISTSTLDSSYTVKLDGLKDGVKYYYKINTFDTEGEEYEGTVLDFSTLPRPEVSLIRIQQVKNAAQPTMLVSWQSNTDISSIVTYYPADNPSQARDEVDVALKTGEHQMLVKGLYPDTKYNLVVKGRDKIGNEAVSDTYTFTTATDTRPPKISDLSVEGSTVPPSETAGQESLAQLIVSWNTDEPATSQVEFGEGTGNTYSSQTSQDTKLSYNHLVIISGLTPSKVYHLRAISDDKAGNESKSIDTVTIAPKTTENALNLVITNLQQAFGFLRNIDGGR
ncbi:MAG: DUF2341 domain-containing protein [Candidatus Pacebacteria bacterium]|nr:DUF2341 domain-containing protein [Candidatus Paceibacterota bacterium]